MTPPVKRDSEIMLTDAAHVRETAPPPSIMDLIPITFKELKEAHYRIVAETRQDRERVGRVFRLAQPGICAYLPYTPYTIRTLACDNRLTCSFVRHLCAAIDNRFGSAPALKLQKLLASEVRSKALLAGRRAVDQVRKLGAVQFAEGGVLGVHYLNGTRVISDAKRVLLKVLTLLIAFSILFHRHISLEESSTMSISGLDTNRSEETPNIVSGDSSCGLSNKRTCKHR